MNALSQMLLRQMIANVQIEGEVLEGGGLFINLHNSKVMERSRKVTLQGRTLPEGMIHKRQTFHKIEYFLTYNQS